MRHEAIVLRDLIRSENGANARATLLANLVAFRGAFGFEGLHLSAGAIDDVAHLGLLRLSELKFTGEIRHHLIPWNRVRMGGRLLLFAEDPRTPKVRANPAEQRAQKA